MKISCEIIRDLLPLYQEDVCSEESKTMVEEHLSKCESCSKMMKEMQDNGLDETLKTEKMSLLNHCIQKVNKVSKFLGIGCTTIFTIPIVTGIFMSIFVAKNISVSNIIISAILIGIAYYVGFYFDIPLKFVGSQYGKTKKKSFYVGVWLIILYMIPIIVSFIVNLSVNRTLSWFYSVLASHCVAASLTVVPLMVPQKKLLWTLTSFTGSLFFLFLILGLFYGADWVWITCISTLFGLSVIFLPFVLPQLPLKGFWSQHKGLIVMSLNTILLYIVVFSEKFTLTALSVTAVSLIFPWSLFLICRYLKANRWIKAGLCILVGFLVLLGQGSGFMIILIEDNITIENSLATQLYHFIICGLGLIFLVIGFLIDLVRKR